MNPFDVIDETCVTQFDDCADVIVVGLGIAGACAAIEAKRAGGDVIAVERASAGGGASALSSGLFYLGGGTAVQQACGYSDDAQNMYQFMIASMGSDNAQAVRQYCDQNVEHFNWLEQQGVPFERSCYKDKAVFLMGTEGLLSTGNEKVWPYRELARPVPRGHQVTGEGESTGNAAMQPLLQVCSELGVRGYYDTRVQALITDQSGTVVGVKTQQGGDTRFLKANKGVVLATGGFAMNPDMVQLHLQGLSATAEALGSAYSDGSGIQLGVAAGADTDAMQNYIATASIYPPGQLIKGIIVNESGQRFVAEDSYHGRTAEFIAKQSNQRAFLIVDSEIFAYPEIETARHQLIDGYETIEEMEQALAMPKDALVATLNQYNTAARDGVDPDFMKHPEWLKPLDQGPYAAFYISFSQSIYLYMTLGGLKTNANAQVLNSKGIAIPGLYAAGACSAHIPKSGASYASGMSLGPGSFFGRVAGRHIMSSNEDTP
ncbi:FAD-dependent oxidoreductase [Halioxenophilus aromaticivorans]|uniref:FAD-binding protein n=1 Tax=Halioxenophilus aromaticivorans TaxID=1306992 RepID=A0AAV3U6V4_9ALTE